MENTRVQRIIISKNSLKSGFPTKKELEVSGNQGTTYSDYFSQIDELSLKVRNLFNHANYIVRQEFIRTSKEKEQGLRETANWIRYKDLDLICKKDEPYESDVNDYYSIGTTAIAQSTLRLLDKAWKSYFASIKDWAKHPEKYTGKPKLPKYKKGNKRAVVGLTTNCVKNKDGYVFFSFSQLKNMNNTFKLINKDKRIVSARFVPVGGRNSKIEAYCFEIIQEVDLPGHVEIPEDQEEFDAKDYRIAGIDLGISNLATVVTNCGVDPIVINGRPLKSINAYYNKKKAAMVSDLKKQEDKDWSRRLTNFTQKRNRKVEDYIHKASTKVVEWCVLHQIDILVCGHNTGWKQNSEMGRKNNQTFTCIPHTEFISKLRYKCEDHGILFIETEEGYTSGTSFLDGEEPIKTFYNKKRRKHRGLFVSNEGEVINADVNGAYQIIKKEFPDAYDDKNIDYGKHPVIINL